MTVNLEKNYNKEAENEEAENTSFMDKVNNFLLNMSKIPLKERLFFVQHLALMLRSGISLSSALKTLSKQTANKRFAKILLDIGTQVEKGSEFSKSLLPYKDVFGELFINMIEAGEISGKLESVLKQLFVQMKKENTLVSKVKGALTYPVIIIMAMVGIGGFMIIFIIPKITSIFTEMSIDLPLPTRILIGTSDAVRHNGILSAIIATVTIVLVVKILKTHKGQYIFQAILLKLPVISPIIKKINLARFSRTISSLLKTDIMIIKTFEITASVLGNLHYRKALNQMANEIRKGGKLSDSINKYPHLFTPIVSQMIAIGEETGELDNILVELAEFYEEEIDLIMDNLPAIIEPLLILALGLGVGGVAVAIILPMYSITNAI